MPSGDPGVMDTQDASGAAGRADVRAWWGRPPCLCAAIPHGVRGAQTGRRPIGAHYTDRRVRQAPRPARRSRPPPTTTPATSSPASPHSVCG